jgi:hypothetical protein
MSAALAGGWWDWLTVQHPDRGVAIGYALSRLACHESRRIARSGLSFELGAEATAIGAVSIAAPWPCSTRSWFAWPTSS